MIEFILEYKEKYQIDPTSVCFEVTETAAIANLSNASTLIKQLKGHGFSFSLDDFGSGMSSFACLKNLPVDYLKIDGIFVKDILNDPIDLAMVQSINNIGHAMGLKTITEYVESQSILDDLSVDILFKKIIDDCFILCFNDINFLAVRRVFVREISAIQRMLFSIQILPACYLCW